MVTYQKRDTGGFRGLDQPFSGRDIIGDRFLDQCRNACRDAFQAILDMYLVRRRHDYSVWAIDLHELGKARHPPDSVLGGQSPWQRRGSTTAISSASGSEHVADMALADQSGTKHRQFYFVRHRGFLSSNTKPA